MVSDRQTVSQAIAECLQCGEAAKLLSRQGFGMTKSETEIQGMIVNINVSNAREIIPGKTYALEIQGYCSPDHIKEIVKSFQDKTGAKAVVLANMKIGNAE